MSRHSLESGKCSIIAALLRQRSLIELAFTVALSRSLHLLYPGVRMARNKTLILSFEKHDFHNSSGKAQLGHFNVFVSVNQQKPCYPALLTPGAGAAPPPWLVQRDRSQP